MKAFRLLLASGWLALCTLAVAQPSTQLMIAGALRQPLTIDAAGLAVGGRDGWKTLVVVATATDGYRAVFSWPEIANTPVGDGVLVLFERDGQPLPAREGAIALLSTTDRVLGARHVRNLMRIELRTVD
jgi:hypothetical protein